MKYIALLRGINVGGNNRIAMADLRALHAGIGHTDVLTHLQSGNVVFTAGKAGTDTVARAIEAAITGELGLSIRVVVRTGPEMRAVVEHDPLAGVATDPARHLVTFLSAAPAADKLAAITEADYAPERFAVQGREVYMWLPDGIRDAKLARINWDRKFGVVATGRNWNTVTKLADMAQD
jgi:uncharacterized protein (DUF1697 family)